MAALKKSPSAQSPSTQDKRARNKSLPSDFHFHEEILTDNKRDRKLPISIFYSANTNQETPTIIFMHGKEITKKAYFYLAKEWVKLGLNVVFPQHIGKSEDTDNPSNWILRHQDISFLFENFEHLNLNCQSVGLGGHSLGSVIALLFANAQNANFENLPTNPDVKGYFTISAPGPNAFGFRKDSYHTINSPIFYMYGKEEGPEEIRGVRNWREQPFLLTKAPTYRAILDNTDHFSYLDALVFEEGKVRSQNSHVLNLVSQLSCRFWNQVFFGSKPTWDLPGVDLASKGFHEP